MGAPKGADGRTVPRFGPHVEAGGDREFKEEDVGLMRRGEPRPFGWPRRTEGHAPLTLGWGHAHASNEQASETTRALTAGDLWRPCLLALSGGAGTRPVARRADMCRFPGENTQQGGSTKKRYLVIVLVALVSLGLGSNGFAQESKGSARGAMGSNPADGPRMDAFMVEEVIGSKRIDVCRPWLGKES
jgi:hypothetical protein